ncbi:MAG TPA: hypothetical protein H9745_07820 [Candidatus Agathobaculum stercoravium]|nr:hypothetical protein [Candidatus Agathobaculum stercoravium]
MKKILSTPVMAVSAVIVWLAACALLTWASFAYDGALSGNPVYFWVYGGAILFAGAVTENYTDGWTTDRGPRWASALLLLVCTALAYLLFDRYDIHLLQFLLHDLMFWWLVLLLLGWLGISAYQHSRFRRPMKPRRQHTSFYNACAFLLIMFLPLLAAALLYLAVFHPVTVDEITPIGEAEGGRFIGRITGDRTETPLGLYFFADGDHWYYYDVLTGAPAGYDDPIRWG